jgi:hypothetical protein
MGAFLSKSRDALSLGDEPQALYTLLRISKAILWTLSTVLILGSAPIWAVLHPLRSWFEVCTAQQPLAEGVMFVGGAVSLVPFGNICTFRLADGSIVSTSWLWWEQAWGYLWVLGAVALVATIMFRAVIVSRGSSRLEPR